MSHSLFRFGLFSIIAVTFCTALHAQPQSIELTAQQIQILRKQAVSRINADRSEQKLPPVQLDDLASSVGDAHCKEVVDRGVISHWSLDGRKPYMRYSWAGGRDAVAENLAYVSGNVKLGAENLSHELNRLEDGFLSERPPNDGHRQNILTATHTHVGVGISWSRDGICYAQEFLDRYVSVEPIKSQASLRDSVIIKGKVLSVANSLYLIEVTYEPLPKPMTLAELQATYEYTLPQNNTFLLRPKAPAGMFYADGKLGEITQENNSFEATVPFFKQVPGVYTIVVWVMSQEKRIQATMISIKVTG
jgi:uncharacterized protein YkwD